MGQSDDEEERHEKQGFKRRPLYTVRQPPLIQPLRVSAFTQKTYSQLGIPPEDLAHEWVVLFKGIAGGKMGGGMPLHIPDTVLLSPSGQPSVWYTTSASGRVTEKDLMRVSPQAICEAFRTPLSQHQCAANTKTLAAVRRLGFQVDTMSSGQLKVFCKGMEYPDISLPLGLTPTTSIARSESTKGVFCLQRYIPCQNNASFLIVWRHSPVVSSNEQPGSTFNTTQAALGCRDRGIHSTCHSKSIQRTPRAHSDVFLLTEAGLDVMSGNAQGSNYDVVAEAVNPWQAEVKSPNSPIHLDIEHSESTTSKDLRKSGFDPDVMTPLLFYMKRVTSEIANCINLGHNARQACGVACEFFIGEHDRSVYFSALRGIQWVASAPSWELSRYVDPLSRSLCEFYEGSSYKLSKGTVSPSRTRSPKSHDRFAYYEQNPRFPSVHTPFAGDKQWLHRSQLLAPDISPRYIGASVPKIYRDGVFQSLLTAHQADSVVRLNLSPQAPSTLTEVRREQPHLSPRSISFRRKTTKMTTDTSSKAL